jgi:NAD(P)-dependent dehydrogenase (short-subunit alcohol dehydrogenase family)
MQKSNPKKEINKKQEQDLPGLESKMDPQPGFDNGMPGSGRLEGKKCIVTGGDSGIGRAVAVAFAKEGADVAIIFLPEEKEDAGFTVKYIQEKFGKKCLPVATDISKENNCRKAIDKILQNFGNIDVLVNNAAFQFPQDDISKISSDQLLHTYSVNIFAMFWIVQSVLPAMKKGSCIINTT